MPQVASRLLLSRVFVLGFPQFDYNVSWCWSFSICVTWRLLSFLNVYIHVFHQISEGFSCYFFKHSFCPFLSPSGTPAVCSVGPLDGVPQVTFHQSFFFLFLSLDSFHCPFLMFADSSACSNLPLNLCSECFICVTVLFSSRISFWFLLRFPISLFMFPFCSYFAFLTSFPSSCGSLSIFTMVVLKFCLEDLPSGVFQGQLLLMYFFPLNGLYFPMSL